jgi:protein TonB
MLRTLLESNAPRQRRRASTLASVAIHTVIIGGAIAATAAAKPGAATTPVHPRDTVIFVAPREETRPANAGAARSASSRRDVPIVPSLPPIRFGTTQTSAVAIDIDVGRLFGDDQPPTGSGFGPRGPSGRDTTDRTAGEPATAATVDRPAAMRSVPRPRYPEHLRAASVTGRVVVRLVVDTLGRVEPASVAIRESSHHLFEQAVRAVLPALRFTPAEVAGRRVRMLVELPFEFRLND